MYEDNLLAKRLAYAIKDSQLKEKLLVMASDSGSSNIDWNCTSRKYFIQYNYMNRKLYYDTTTMTRMHGVIYFNSVESVTNAIDKLGNLIIKLYDIERELQNVKL